ncbi:MAG TPA: glycosyl hydrolase [Polyangiaceae bacterium]|jgi:hypothetical protein|nr:glycosyl hydrolase [Polyangiaceae bacterium]
MASRTLLALCAFASALSGCSSNDSASRAYTDGGADIDGGAGEVSSGGGAANSAGGVANGAGDGGARPSNGVGGSSNTGGATNDAEDAGDGGNDAALDTTSTKLLFGPYKDTTVAMNWNTNVVSTNLSGTMTSLGDALTTNGVGAVTLAFATGECGSETWGGLAGDDMAKANVPLLTKANIRYVVSTGGAAGVFSCATDAGFDTFVARWASANLVGIDFDLEAGQTKAQIEALVHRIDAAHGAHPELRFSLTLATLAANDGASTAHSLGSAAPDAFNEYGDEAMAAVASTLGWNGGEDFPAFLTVNLMTMDYGAAGSGVCVVSGGKCQMGQSALQAAYDLHDKWSVPYDHMELTPMLGGNDAIDEEFTLDDIGTLTAFATSQKLAGVHFWSLDRDVDCAAGAASATCNTMGAGYAGPFGYLKAFQSALR